jgi:hypothetical protein
MAHFAFFNETTVNLDQVTHITRNNACLVFHLVSGNMIQCAVPSDWPPIGVIKFMHNPLTYAEVCMDAAVRQKGS